jgi:hypothetical protein
MMSVCFEWYAWLLINHKLKLSWSVEVHAHVRFENGQDSGGKGCVLLFITVYYVLRCLGGAATSKGCPLEEPLIASFQRNREILKYDLTVVKIFYIHKRVHTKMNDNNVTMMTMMVMTMSGTQIKQL